MANTRFNRLPFSTAYEFIAAQDMTFNGVKYQRGADFDKTGIKDHKLRQLYDGKKIHVRFDEEGNAVITGVVVTPKVKPETPAPVVQPIIPPAAGAPVSIGLPETQQTQQDAPADAGAAPAAESAATAPAGGAEGESAANPAGGQAEGHGDKKDEEEKDPAPAPTATGFALRHLGRGKWGVVTEAGEKLYGPADKEAAETEYNRLVELAKANAPKA